MAKVVITKSKLDALAQHISAKAGTSGTLTIAQMQAAVDGITGGVEAVHETWSQVNPLVSAYLDAANYSPTDYSTSVVGGYCNEQADYRKDEPTGVTVEVAGGTAHIVPAGAYRATTDTVQSGAHTFYNLIPGTSYLSIENDGNIASYGKLLPTGAVRMIYAPSIRNVRDLGGWTCNGGVVKYGRLYRGSEFDQSEQISADDIKRIKVDCGVNVDLDLRYESALTASPLGDGVEYVREYGSYYKDALDLEQAGKLARTKAILNVIFDRVKRGKNVYFHCAQGKDRTGTISGLLLGILGVAQGDCDKDYELTSFAIQGDAAAYCARNTENTAQPNITWKAMMQYLATFDGNNLEERICSWMILAGVALDQINEFRRHMIDGSPADLTNKINYHCKSLSIGVTTLAVAQHGTGTIIATPAPSWQTDAITATSSNPAIATATVSGKEIIVHGIAAGSCNITIICGEQTAVCACTVEAVQETWINVFDPATAQLNKRVNSSGSIVTYNGHMLSDLIAYDNTDTAFAFRVSGAVLVENKYYHTAMFSVYDSAGSCKKTFQHTLLPAPVDGVYTFDLPTFTGYDAATFAAGVKCRIALSVANGSSGVAATESDIANMQILFKQ